jgi:hypothetical protein
VATETNQINVNYRIGKIRAARYRKTAIFETEVQAMTNTLKAALFLGFAVSSPLLANDLYRCDEPGRRTVYQGTQCDIGMQQKAIDPANARREQIQKTLEQERKRKQQKTEAETTAG